MSAQDFKSLVDEDDDDSDEDDETTTCTGSMIESWSELTTPVPVADVPQIKSLGDKKLARLAEQMREAFKGSCESSLTKGDNKAMVEPDDPNSNSENITRQQEVKDLGDQLKALVLKSKEVEKDVPKPSQELPPHVAWLKKITASGQYCILDLTDRVKSRHLTFIGSFSKNDTCIIQSISINL